MYRFGQEGGKILQDARNRYAYPKPRVVLTPWPPHRRFDPSSPHSIATAPSVITSLDPFCKMIGPARRRLISCAACAASGPDP